MDELIKGEEWDEKDESSKRSKEVWAKRQCSVDLEMEMNVSETQKSEKGDNMENLKRNSIRWKSIALNVVERSEETKLKVNPWILYKGKGTNV